MKLQNEDLKFTDLFHSSICIHILIVLHTFLSLYIKNLFNGTEIEKFITNSANLSLSLRELSRTLDWCEEIIDANQVSYFSLMIHRKSMHMSSLRTWQFFTGSPSISGCALACLTPNHHNSNQIFQVQNFLNQMKHTYILIYSPFPIYPFRK